MDVYQHNQDAWDKLARDGNEWSIPASPEVIAAAKIGEWGVLLTESKPAPREWFQVGVQGKGDREAGVFNLDILCLASGGGQQGPILAAAGARVTTLDASPEQLSRDRLVADREGLEITTTLGDMRDLSAFADESFDLVFHPVSNVFVPEILPVWREAYRVLRYGGALLAGFMNPVEYTFDQKLMKEGIYQVKYALPYSDLTSITEEERVEMYGEDGTVEFSHTLEEQIGGQLAAGFVLTDLYEDYRKNDPIAQYMPSYIATRSVKITGR